VDDHIRVLREATCDRGGRAEVGEEESPSGETAGPRRQGTADVLVERAGRGRAPRETTDEGADERHGQRGDEIDEPGAVARHGEDERDGHGRSGGGRDGGDGLRERFHGRQNATPQSEAGVRDGFRRIHVDCLRRQREKASSGLRWEMVGGNGTTVGRMTLR
jgi:hypothetical protein